MRIMHYILKAVAWVAFKMPRNDYFWAYVIGDLFDKNKPYLTRVLFPRMFGHRAMLHYFHTPDFDRHPHNHPWEKAYSFVLSGGYTEERVERVHQAIDYSLWWTSETWDIGGSNSLSSQDFHTVISIKPYTWTLFIAGQRCQSWGFLTKDGYIDHKEYIGQARNSLDLEKGSGQA